MSEGSLLGERGGEVEKTSSSSMVGGASEGGEVAADVVGEEIGWVLLGEGGVGGGEGMMVGVMDFGELEDWWGGVFLCFKR